MHRAWAACLSVAALAVAGCVIETGPATPANSVVVVGPPPPPMAETRSARPGSQAVWVAGYWHWTGMQYTWIPGHWEAPPSGARWRAPRYSLREGQYYYEPGGWSRP